MWQCVKHENVEYETIEEYLRSRFTPPLSRDDDGEITFDYFVGKSILDVWTGRERKCLIHALQFYKPKWNWWDFICYLKCCWFNNRSSLDIRLALQRLFKTSDMNAIIQPNGNCLLQDFKTNISNLPMNINFLSENTNDEVCFDLPVQT